jgi:transcriptional regulator with XRE-family HTH domain
MTETSQIRLKEILAELTQQGLTQQQIAERINMPSQFLSNLKNGHRPLTELVARRIGAVFQINYEWLLGIADEKLSPMVSTEASSGNMDMAPLFDEPIEGQPRSHTLWEGALLELSGAAAARFRNSVDGYVLRCPVNDSENRIHQGDLLLVSQEHSPDASIQVVRYRKRLVLARCSDDEQHLRLPDAYPLGGRCDVVGVCVGVVWAPLM